MLQLWLGRSGSGKTARVYDAVEAALSSGADDRVLVGGMSVDSGPSDRIAGDRVAGGAPLLLVPEQFSFETERQLLRQLGPRGANVVKVLSFTRMAQAYFQAAGGGAGQRMDGGVRTLLMSEALHQMAGELTLYRRSRDSDMVGALLRLHTECKRQLIIPQALLDAAETIGQGALRQKAKELGLIFGAFEALAGASYVDPLDDLTLLAGGLRTHALFQDAQVYVDGFQVFTAQEFTVLHALLKQAADVTVTLCLDNLNDGGLGRFAAAADTAASLTRLAHEAGVPVRAPVYFTENFRTVNGALRAVEAGCLTPSPEIYVGEGDSVTLLPCRDAYEECSQAARAVGALLRQGVRCRDIAVVARQLEDYDGILDAALAREGVAFYMDRRARLADSPLFVTVTAALRAVTESFDADVLLQLMKTGLLRFSPEETGLFENYLFTWRLTGRALRRPFTANPEGLSVRESEASRRTLGKLNKIRERLMAPLERLHTALAGGADGLQFAAAVYAYLTNIGMIPEEKPDADDTENLPDSTTSVPNRTISEANQKPDILSAPAFDIPVWNALMHILDKFAAALPDASLTGERLTRLFASMADAEDLGSIPQVLDAVQVGAADRMRFDAPRAVFVLGANEGVFPACPGGGELLSDREREALHAAGLPLPDARVWAAAQERFFAYAAVSAPSERLYISYLADRPSILVRSVQYIVPACSEVISLPPQSAAGVLADLAANWRNPTPEAAARTAAMKAALDSDPRLCAMARSADSSAPLFENSAAATALFGADMTLSASRVEQFYQCRFAYFCRYGLRAQTRRRADLDALSFGTLVHDVMQRVLPIYTKEGFHSIPRARAFADAKDAVETYVEDIMGGREDKSERFSFLLSRLTVTCGHLLWQVVLELRQSKFVPVDYELPIDFKEGVPPVTLTLPDGSKVRVEGKIDRVDTYTQDGVTYVRVIDYKTGSKEFALSDVLEGINAQMLLYLMTLWESGATRYTATKQGQLLPAGVLYLPAKLPVVRIEAGDTAEDIEQKQVTVMRMNGLLLRNEDVLRAMEPDMAGLFIPVTKKSGRNAPLVTLTQFGQLKGRIEHLLRDMAAALQAGNIVPLPAHGREGSACERCDFRAVCGHEASDPEHTLAVMGTAEALAKLAAGDAQEAGAAEATGAAHTYAAVGRPSAKAAPKDPDTAPVSSPAEGGAP